MNQQTQQKENEERPAFVKSVNLKHSKNMVFPDEPPTDKQVQYMAKLGFIGDLPKTRKEASEAIQALLNGKQLDQVNEYRKKHGLPLKESVN